MTVDENEKENRKQDFWANHYSLHLELDPAENVRWGLVKDYVLSKTELEFDKIIFLNNVLKFVKELDVENMNIIEAMFYNMLTNKTFVKNSWSNESKAELQMFYENNRKITQNKDKVDSCSSSISLDSTKYSLYRGEYASKQGEEKKKRERLEELELKIGSLYSEFKEYEALRKELNQC